MEQTKEPKEVNPTFVRIVLKFLDVLQEELPELST